MNPPQANFDFTIGQCATLACLIEVTAPKPGNVHRGADFEDSAYPDFLVAGTIIGPILEAARRQALGQTVLAAVTATRHAVGHNTNLGMILLIAPLAMVPRQAALPAGVTEVLGSLTPNDAADVYAAIRLAKPGGLGRAAEADVGEPAPSDLIAAMRLSAERDLVARQYANGFQQVFETAGWLAEALSSGLSLLQATVHVHLRLMSEFPDSLIARKCGIAVAEHSAARARAALQAGDSHGDAYSDALADLDFWLRSDHHRRNPGTTADLVAAGLFVALRDGIIKPPLRLAF